MTGGPASTVHMIWDRDGNLIAEADAATGVIKREYIWLGSRPIAVVDDVDTSPVLYQVHVDHLDRPVLMTNSVGNVVWRASYLPFGEVHSTTGPASPHFTLDHHAAPQRHWKLVRADPIIPLHAKPGKASHERRKFGVERFGRQRGVQP